MSRKKIKAKRTYTLHGQTLENVTSTKYLGVTLQYDGSWGKHISEVTTRANRLLGFLSRNLKIQSKAVKSRAYKTLLRPTLEYAAAIWDPYTENLIQDIEKVQRRAARFVTRQYRHTSSVSAMLADLNWPALSACRKTARLCLFWKIRNGTVHMNCNLSPAPFRQSRRHNQQLAIVFSTKDYRKYAFFPRTIQDWNGLSQHTLSASKSRSTPKAFAG